MFTTLLHAGALLALLVAAPPAARAAQGGGSLRDAVGGDRGTPPAASKKPAPKKPSAKSAANPPSGKPAKAPAGAAKPAARPADPARHGTVRLTIREGTEVPLAFAESLSSKSADEDDEVKFILADDLSVDGIVVAKAGAPARGLVSKVKKAGWFGKDAKLAVTVEYLEVGDVRLGLRGKKTKDGDEAEGIGEAFDAVKGVFVKSENVKIKEGTVVTAYVAADTAVTLARP